MTKIEGWRTRFAGGVIAGLLTLVAVMFMFRGSRIPQLIAGTVLGFVAGFGAAYLEIAIRRGLMTDSMLGRAVTLLLSPPLLFLLLGVLHWQQVVSRDLVIGFFLSGFASWFFAHGLRGLMEAPVPRARA